MVFNSAGKGSDDRTSDHKQFRDNYDYWKKHDKKKKRKNKKHDDFASMKGWH